MISCEFIKNKIENNLKGARVIVDNPKGNDVHFFIDVEFDGFKEKNRVEQHKMVFKALDEKLGSCGEPLHSIQIKTRIPKN